MTVRPLAVFAAVCILGAAVACSSTISGVPNNTTPPNCAAPNCVQLTNAPTPVRLAAVAENAVTVSAAGSGYVGLLDGAKPFGASPPLLVAVRNHGNSPIVYVQISALGGSATLFEIPEVTIAFAHVPAGALRLAVLDGDVWTTAGKPGVVNAKRVTFAATAVDPAIHLSNGTAYELSVYAGGVLPATPTPSPSPTASPTPTPTPTPTPSPTPTPTPTPTPIPTPTPGVFSVNVSCAQTADACSNGTTSTAGSVQFTAIGNTALLTPLETGPSTTFTLKSDTCNKSDDPPAGGNWANFAPGVGSVATSFTVTAANAGASRNPANCSAVIADRSGRMVSISIQVTISGIGVNAR